MKKLLIVSLLTLTLLPLAGNVLAQAVPSIDAELALNSKYVWRGMTITDDPVLQPGVSATLGGIGASIWGNIDTSDVNGNEWEFNEIDYSLFYSLGAPMVSLDFGFIYYDFPNTNADATTELFVAAEASVILSPHVAIYRDIDEIKGTYFEIGAAHTLPIGTMGLELSADLGLGSEGYNKGYFGVGGVGSLTDDPSTGFNNLTIGAALPLDIIPLISLTPSVSYATLMGDAKDAMDENTDAVWFGLTAGFHF